MASRDRKKKSVQRPTDSPCLCDINGVIILKHRFLGGLCLQASQGSSEEFTCNAGELNALYTCLRAENGLAGFLEPWLSLVSMMLEFANFVIRESETV